MNIIKKEKHKTLIIKKYPDVKSFHGTPKNVYIENGEFFVTFCVDSQDDKLITTSLYEIQLFKEQHIPNFIDDNKISKIENAIATTIIHSKNKNRIELNDEAIPNHDDNYCHNNGTKLQKIENTGFFEE